MQLTDSNGNIYGIGGLEITGIDGKPKVPVIPATLIVNSTPITGGAVGRVLFEGAGNVLQESSNLFWDDTNNRLGIKRTNPVVEIDVIGDIRASSRVYTDTCQFNTIQTSGSNLITRGVGGTAYITMFQSTGNLLLQNGGTFTDAGFRLDVVGSDARINTLRIGLGGGQVASNTAIGANTLNANTIGVQNTALGQNSQVNNTSGNSNTSIGFVSLGANTTGYQNTSIGASTLLNITGGHGNSVVGFYSLNGLTSGNQNTTLGAFSGRFLADGSTVLTTLNNSILIGYQAYPLGNAQTNQIVIGHNAIGLGSNSVVLGNSSITLTALRGNVLINTTTDAGFKLDVNGTARIQNQLTTTGSISASSLIARGTYLNQTLVATANNDVLVGLDIQPTFTNGAFTGVTNTALRVNGSITPTIAGNGSLGLAGVPFNNAFFSGIVFSNTYQNYSGDITFSLGYVNAARFFSSTKNFLIQNGGTFTDAGYRLDVNGTTRLQSTLLVSGATTTTGLITANGGISSSLNGYGVTIGTNAAFSNDTTRLAQSPATWIWHDLFAFNRYNATYETYDGITWSSATLNTELFAQKQTQSIQVINTTILASRWTFNLTGWGTGQWLVIGVAWDASIATYNVLLESYDGTAWVTRHTSNSSVAANNYFASVSAYSGDNQLRVTITRTGGGNNLNISNIKLLTARPGDQGVGSDVEFPYYWNGTRSIGIGTSSVINASAILDVGSTTKGFLPPRMSNAQMLAIASPAAGLIVYDTTSQKHFGYNGSSWNAFF